MKKLSRSIISLLLAFMLLVSPAYADASSLIAGVEQYYALDSVASYIDIFYKFDADRDKLLNVAFYEKLTNPEADTEDMISAMMDSLDPHSAYLDKDEYKLLMDQTINGEFCGIGVSIQERSGRCVVVSPIKDSPAEKAGIIPNDIIASVNGEDVLGKTIEYIQSLVMGEEGTSVKLGILRGEEILTMEIVRKRLKNTSVSYEIMDGIGYISVSSFTGTTPDDTKAALSEFDQRGINKIIIDLRYNPGGELNSAITFSNLFIPKGLITKIEYANEESNQMYYSENENPKYKIALLINEGSASASELFSAAAKDTGVAKLFGETSYGKGTMQTVASYGPTGGALRLTIAEFLSPLGNKINEVGVSPDVYVENTTSTRDTSHFLPFDVTVVNDWGDTHENVKALQQRLAFLGYYDGKITKEFDKKTKIALETYQAYNNLPVTGCTDLETALSINNIDYAAMLFYDDLQLEEAKEYLKSLK